MLRRRVPGALRALRLADLRGLHQEVQPLRRGHAAVLQASASRCPTRADVKIRGVIVGEVLEVADRRATAPSSPSASTRTSGTTIPADVTAQILPKTLFGEKYVALEVPPAAGGQRDRGRRHDRRSPRSPSRSRRSSTTSSRCCARCSPAELNYTLTAIANALEGRGEQIGESLETLDGYLKRMNPEIPALIDNLDQARPGLGRSTSRVVPELARLLRNTRHHRQHLRGASEEQIQALFNDVAGLLRDHAATSSSATATTSIRSADQGRPDPAAAGAVLPGVPVLPGRCRRQHRPERGGVPRQDPAHQPRDAAAPAARLRPRETCRSTTTQPRPFPYCDELYAGDQRPVRPEQPPAARGRPADRNDGVNYPIGKGRAPAVRRSVTPSPAPAPSRRHRRRRRARAGRRPSTTSPTWPPLLLGPLARGMEVDVR